MGRLFDQNEVEFFVGNLIVQHPKPSRQEIDRFTNGLPEFMADNIEDFGWNNLALAVDNAVLDAIRDPGLQAEMMRALNFNQATVMALVDGVRRTAFCRKSEIIREAGMFGYYAA